MLDEIAMALPLIAESASELAQAARLLPEEHSRSRAVLLLHADEEAAKGLMLLDLVRCPKRRRTERARLADQITRHLPRLIYAEACRWAPADFAEVRRHVNFCREEFYLDGPNDVDWIFPNDLLYRREALLYVDRFQWEDEVRWQSPETLLPIYHRSDATLLVQALASVGAFRREALDLAVEWWDPLDIKDDMHWQEFADLNRVLLQKFEARGWLAGATESEVATALDWPVPLYSLDLSPLKVPLEKLQERRARWSPGV